MNLWDLQAYEVRLNRSIKNNEDMTFQVMEKTTKYGENNSPTSKAQGKGELRDSRGRDYGRS